MAIHTIKQKKRKILFLTGTRADFGKLKPLMLAVDKSKEFICDIFVTGMHTLKRYGSTHYEVSKANFKNIHIYINQFENEPMELILANTISGLSRFVHENKPDMIIVHGDRIETLAGSIVGTLNNILTCHIEGGEVSGTIDELIRHSVSKLAHLHLVANKESKNRLIQMGELAESIFIIGSPDIDIMQSSKLPTIDSVKQDYQINFRNYAIAMLHPVTTEINQMSLCAKIFVDTLIKSKKNYVIIYPNNDTGSQYIIDSYSTIKNSSNFRIFPSIRFEKFLTLLKNAMFIVGNSSIGIREAPVYGIPAINIGTRQNNRHSHQSIIDVNFENKAILNAISKALSWQHIPQSNFFGEGNSTELFLRFIHNQSIWNFPIQKKFQDIFVNSIKAKAVLSNDRNNPSQRGVKRPSWEKH